MKTCHHCPRPATRRLNFVTLRHPDIRFCRLIVCGFIVAWWVGDMSVIGYSGRFRLSVRRIGRGRG